MSREMKNSGIPWIGEIPKEWRVCRVKDVLENSKDGIRIGPFGSALTNKVEGVGAYKIYGQWNIVGKDFSEGKNYISEETYKELKQYRIVSGDILISLMGTVGKCAVIPYGIQDGIMDSHVIKVRLNNRIYSKFFAYSYDKDCSSFVFGQIQRMKKGSIMDGLNSSIVKNLVLLLPPLKEQLSITRILDKKCGEIDEMVTLQERIIEELKAYKQSVITEAVTKGLNPNVPMKDSGIEWIGKMPEDWSALKTLFVLEMPITDGPHTTPDLYETGIPFVSAEAVSCGNGGIDFSHIRGFISKEFYDECCLKYVPQRGDVYMIKSGATTGRVSIVDTDRVFTIWSPLAVFRANRNIVLPRYLFYSIQGDYYLEQVRVNWTFGTQQNIGMRTLETLIIALPPLQEQQSIADYLDTKCAEIDTLISLKQSKIEALKEYQKSIIYEYVTGKKEITI